MDHSLHDLLRGRMEGPGGRSQIAMTRHGQHLDPYWVPSPLVDSHVEVGEFVRRLKARGDGAR